MADLTLREIQERLTTGWADTYGALFRASPVAYKDLQHAHLHVMKALGKLAALIEEADHDYATTFPKEEVAKYLADLVICAHRMANKNATGPIDMEAAILARMEVKMGTLPEEEDVDGEETICLRCGWDMQTELDDGWMTASRSLAWTKEGMVCSHCLRPGEQET